ncbi:MAG: TonB family protein [Planctomycetota bacterium]
MSTAWWYWSDEEHVAPPQIAVELAEPLPEVSVDVAETEVKPPVEPEPEVLPVVEVEATPLEKLEELPVEEYQAVRPWMPRGHRYRPSMPPQEQAKETPKPPPHQPVKPPVPPVEPEVQDPVASVVLAPQIDARQCPAPEYPRRARRLRWEGTTQLLVTVDTQGSPIAISVQTSSGHEMLDEAAKLAVWEWRFHPAKRDGVAEQGDLLVPIRFHIVD